MRKSKVQRGLTIAVIEAAVCAVMLAATDNWLVPLLQLRLHASPFIIGQLTYIPFLALALTGPVIGHIIRAFGSNKRMVIITGIFQVLMLFGLLIPTFYPDLAVSLPLGVAFGVAVGVIGCCAAPAWMAWMAELVPRRVRGRYWGNRLQIMLTCKLLFTVLFAMLISEFPLKTRALGIAIVLICAGVARSLSLALLFLQPENKHALEAKPIVPRERLPTGIFTFIRTSPVTELGRWTLVYSLMLFGVTTAGPYFAVYMLADAPRGLGLGDSPIMYMVLLQTAWITRLLFFNAAGKLIDRFGPTPLLRIAIAGILLLPIAWACTTSLPILILNEIVSGLLWCLAEGCVGVLLLATGGNAEGARLIGFHQTIASYAIVLGSLTGGVLLALNILPKPNGSEFHSLFLFSMLMRLPSFLLALRFLPAHPELRIRRGLWRLIPGLEPTITFSKDVIRFLRRP